MEHLADAPIANILILAGVIFVAVGVFGRIGGFIGSIFGNIEAGRNSRVLAGVLGSVLILGGVWMHQQSDKSAPHTAPSTESANNSTNKTNLPATGANTDSKTTPPVTGNDADVRNAKLTADASPKKTQPYVAPTIPAADREKLPASPVVVGDDRLIDTWTNVIPPRVGDLARIQITRAGSGLDAHLWEKCSSGECDLGTYRLAISGNTARYEYVYGNRRRVGSMNVYAPNVLLASIDIYEPGTSQHWHHNRVFANSNLSGKTQVAFSRYLDSPGQKAFAMTPAGAWSLHFKSNTAEEASQIALQHCQNHGLRDCRIILLNDEGPQ
jgi:hypothetical protein